MKNNEYVRLGGVLFAITAAVALLLGIFNGLTADVIAETKEEKKNESMKAVMADASYYAHSSAILPEDGNIVEIYDAFDSAGTRIGWCFSMTPKGYGGEIEMTVGISEKEMAVTGVDIINHGETPSLGANAAEPEWLAQFAGKTAGLTVVKTAPQGNQIQAVTSATITSRAVTGAVDEALAFAQSIAEQEGK